MRKKAVIVGSSGQDGRIVCTYLSNKDYVLFGIDKPDNSSNENCSCQKVSLNIEDTEKVYSFIKDTLPDELYYFAAFHHSSEDKIVENIDLLQESYKVQVLSFMNFLEGIRIYSPKTRVFYAASSLIFGNAESDVQNEETMYNPDSIYGITKLDGLHICRMYREKYGIFVSVGILYNHESGYRSKKFLSKKIISSALAIRQGKETQLMLGDMKAKVDWGYAPDYIDAMYKILQLKQSGEFVIATGEVHSVMDFVEEVFGQLGLDWRRYVKEDETILVRKRNVLVGDSSKLRRLTHWKPSVSFEGMISRLIEEYHD